MEFILTNKDLKELYEYIEENKKGKAANIFFNILKNKLLIASTANFSSKNQKVEEADLIKIIKENKWQVLKEINVLPAEKSYFYYVLDSNKKELPLILSFFEKKGVHLLIEILKEDLQKIAKAPYEHIKERAIKLSLNRNQSLLYAMSKPLPNILKDINDQTYFMQYIDHIVNKSHGDAQQFVISAINYGLNNNIEHTKLLDWFVKLVKNNITITTKNIEEFTKLTQNFTQEELKPFLTIQEFNRVFDEQNTGVLEKESVATVYTIDLVKLKMSTKTSALTLRNNFKLVLPILDTILYDLDDFVSIKSSEDKQSFEINLLYEKEGSGNSKKVVKRILNYVVNSTSAFDINLSNDLNKIKNATLLEHKLSQKETIKVKNKI